jgi:O-antigen/teichoic acid export membrane protein
MPAYGLLFLKSGWVVGAEALALGSLTGTAFGVTGGVLIDTIRRLSSPRPPRARWIDLKVAKDVAVFGVPMIGWFLCTYALTVTDKTALATWSTLSEVGAYGALMSIATGVASLLITPLVMACHPTMAAAWNMSATREEPTMVVNAYLKAFALLAAPTIVFVWAAEPQIAALLLPAGYGHSRTLFALLTAAMLTSMLGLLAHKGLEMAEATGTLFGLMLGAVVLNVLLLIVLVPRAGAVGAAIAVLLTQIAYVGGALVASRRYVRMSLRPQFLANIAAATAAAALLTPILTRGFITLP